MAMRFTKYQHRHPGFTIVELLIVIAILGILAAVTVLGFNGVQQSAGEAVLKSDLANADRQLENAKTLAGSYPANADTVKKSNGTTFEYTRTGENYCITASSESVQESFFYSTTNRTIQEGACPGHSGGTVAVNQPSSCPAGFIPVPGNPLFGTDDGFCVMKYEAKPSGGSGAASVAAGTPSGYYDDPIDYDTAVSRAAATCAGCGLITEAEWLTIAHNVLNVGSNWTSGTVGVGKLYVGNSDGSAEALAASSNDADGYFGTGNSAPSDQRRTLTLSNGEVIWDFAGNQAEWTPGLIAEGPGNTGYENREWNAANNTNPPMNPNPFPVFGTPAAGSWTSAQGIGMLYSDSSDPYPNYFLRGGAWDMGTQFTGVFALDLSWPENYFTWSHGYRVAQ